MVQAEKIVKMTAEKMIDKIINTLWLMLIGMFHIFRSIFQFCTMHIHFSSLLGLYWKASSKEDSYTLQGSILKMMIIRWVRILLIKKMHASYGKTTLPLISLTSSPTTFTTFIPPSLSSHTRLLAVSYIPVMHHFKASALVLPSSWKFRSTLMCQA